MDVGTEINTIPTDTRQEKGIGVSDTTQEPGISASTDDTVQEQGIGAASADIAQEQGIFFLCGRVFHNSKGPERLSQVHNGRVGKFPPISLQCR